MYYNHTCTNAHVRHVCRSRYNFITIIHVYMYIPPEELCRDCTEPRSDCSDVATDSVLRTAPGCGLGWSDTIPLELSSVSLDVVIWG